MPIILPGIPGVIVSLSVAQGTRISLEDSEYWVQVVAARSPITIERVRASFTGFRDVPGTLPEGNTIRDTIVWKDSLYRLWLGPFFRRADAERFRQQILSSYPGAFLVRVSSPAPRTVWVIQTGVFSDKTRALQHLQKLQHAFPDISFFQIPPDSHDWAKVWAGPWFTREEAEKYVKEIRELAPDAFILEVSVSRIPEENSSFSARVRHTKFHIQPAFRWQRMMEILTLAAESRGEIPVYRVSLYEAETYEEALKLRIRARSLLKDSLPVWIFYTGAGYRVEAGVFLTFAEALWWRYALLKRFPSASVVRVHLRKDEMVRILEEVVHP